MTFAPDIDERLQVIRCMGCENVSLVGDCESDLHQRLVCPRCENTVPAECIHEFVLAEVTDL